MFHTFKARPVMSLVAFTLSSWSAHANNILPNVEVLGLRAAPNAETPDETLDNLPPPADAADLLRNVPGVAVGRMGGRGLEPSIRGQSRTQLNVLIDGGFIEGGCPNRMDPPTSFATMGTIDKITVIKGVQTLRYGAGGSGGTILFERTLEKRDDGLQGELSLGGGLNGLGLDSNLLLRGSTGDWYGMASAEKASAENYKDGDGRTVRSAFERSGHLIGVGYRLNTRDRLEFIAERTDTRDALFPGAGMDAPMDRSDQYRVRYKAHHLGVFDFLQFDYARSDVAHLMDNYSLRAAPAMLMRVPSSSDSEDIKLYTEFTGADMQWRAGLQSRDNAKLALRFAGMNPAMVNTLNSVMWPGVEIRQTGLFIEADKPLGEHSTLTAGLRHDEVDASASLAGLTPAGMGAMSPNALYSAYYGNTANSARSESNTGGLLRLNHRLTESLAGFAGLSRTARTADATERYLASNSVTASARWVGNPDIRPEFHNQLDVGVAYSRPGTAIDVVVFHDQVDDYILRDRARGQAGILLADRASVYRNVYATLNGVEMKFNRALPNHWAFSADTAYVRGANNTDGGRPLAQIAPLSGRLAMDQQNERLSYGAEVRWASQQNRVDTDAATGSAVDARATPGWAILNLRGSWRLGPQQQLRFGVSNLFDRTYAEHLNRANVDPFNPQAVQVNEPGRSIWAKVQVRF